MNSSQPWLQRLPLYLAFGSAIAGVFSIAVCHILLGLAFAALLLSSDRLRLPPIQLPLALFVGLTLLSWFTSGHLAEGRPQIRKFYVFLILLVLFSTLGAVSRVRFLVFGWALGVTLSSLLSFRQLYQKYERAHQLGKNFYEYYVPERITGFTSHWMTLGAEQMMVLMLVMALIFFSPSRRKWLPHLLLAAAIIGGSLVAGLTRGIYIAAAGGGLYLLFQWRRWVALAAPCLLALLVWFGPAFIRERADSIIHPRHDLDSNDFRIVCWRTGWKMIQAHPVLGLGPEQVNKQFFDYLPSDVSRNALPSGWYGHLHNVYLQYAAERGIPALLVMLWMLAKILYDYLRALRRLPPGLSEERFVLHGCVAILIAVMIEGMVENNLGDSEVLFLFLASVACGYTAAAAALPALEKDAA